MTDFKVAIVGAGLAGSLLANGLLQAGIDFTVFEAEPQGSKKEDYQIRLGAPAVAGFKRCLTPDQLERLYPMFGRSGGMLSSAPILYDTSLNVMLDLTKYPTYTKSAPINRVVLRDFLAQVPDASGRVKYGKRFTGFEDVQRAQRRKIRLLFDDGTEMEADLLISAEGSVSKVNKQVGLNNIVQLKDKWQFLAKANLTPEKLLSLTPEIQKSAVSVIKDGVIFFFSAYLPAHDKYMAASGDASKAKANPETASLFWSLSIPSEQMPKSGAASITDKLQFCIDHVHDWDPRIHDLLRAVSNDDIHALQPRSSNTPLPNWREKVKKTYNPRLGSDRVWMIGDAMHPMLPSRGMGGNQAMRDTVDALDSIMELQRKAQAGTLNEQDFTRATREYESKVVPRAFEWVKASGGTNQDAGEPQTLIGRMILLLTAGVLNVAYVFSLARQWMGFKVEDDVPELPN